VQHKEALNYNKATINMYMTHVATRRLSYSKSQSLTLPKAANYNYFGYR
jgi:hypothetical protein